MTLEGSKREVLMYMWSIRLPDDKKVGELTICCKLNVSNSCVNEPDDSNQSSSDQNRQEGYQDSASELPLLN